MRNETANYEHLNGRFAQSSMRTQTKRLSLHYGEKSSCRMFHEKSVTQCCPSELFFSTKGHKEVYRVSLEPKVQQLWWHVPFIPAIGRKRRTYLCEFEASLVYQDYTEQPCLETTTAAAATTTTEELKVTDPYSYTNWDIWYGKDEINSHVGSTSSKLAK